MAFSFPEPDWRGTIFRDVGAQSVGKRSEVCERLRSVFVCRIRRILLSRHRSSRRITNPAFQARQPVGQNVRGYPLLRPGQQLAEVTAVAEHQVADDDQAPAIPQRLESQINRAARAWDVQAHSKTNCDIKSVDLEPVINFSAVFSAG